MVGEEGLAAADLARNLMARAKGIRDEIAAAPGMGRKRRRALEREMFHIEVVVFGPVRPYRRCPICFTPIGRPGDKVTKQFCSRECKGRATKGELQAAGRAELQVVNLDHLAHVAWKTLGMPKTSAGSDGIYRFKSESGDVVREMTEAEARAFLEVASTKAGRDAAKGRTRGPRRAPRRPRCASEHEWVPLAGQSARYSCTQCGATKTAPAARRGEAAEAWAEARFLPPKKVTVTRGASSAGSTSQDSSDSGQHRGDSEH